MILLGILIAFGVTGAVALRGEDEVKNLCAAADDQRVSEIVGGLESGMTLRDPIAIPLDDKVNINGRDASLVLIVGEVQTGRTGIWVTVEFGTGEFILSANDVASAYSNWQSIPVEEWYTAEHLDMAIAEGCV